MILFRKLLRTFGKYKAQFISMVLMIILGVGIFTGMNAEWYTIKKDTESFYKSTNLADYRIYNKDGFSTSDLEKVKSISGVDDATRFVELSMQEDREQDTIKLAVTENENVSNFVAIDGEDYDLESLDGIWLSSKYSDKNNYNIGDNITLKLGSFSKTFVIKGHIMSSEYLINIDGVSIMPDYNKLGFAYISPKAYVEATSSILGSGYYTQINVKSNLKKEEFSQKVDEAFGKTMQIVPKEDITSYSEAKGEQDEGKTMGTILPVIFLLIAVLTMITTMNRILANEKTQIGILKSLGFKNKKIIWHYSSIALYIGVVGSILGLGLGYGVCKFIMNPSGSMGTYFEMPSWQIYFPWFAYVGTLAIIGLLMLVVYISIRKVLKGPASEALRPYTPKKVKKMLIENTKLFHKLNFKVRWNMRDSVRHKTRTFVTIFGVFACSLLIFATFGMKSTMDTFIEVNYNVVMNYKSKVFLSENTDNTKALEIADNLKGDYSSSNATKIDGETYTITIFSTEYDMYRVVSNNNKIEVTNDGAYISTRMADELKLKEGNTFKFTYYGESVSYNVKVAKIVNSLSDGFQMTANYADSSNISYKIDTVYTDIEKDKITLDSNISTVQSKQDIIKSFDTFTELMNEMILILVLFSSVLGFVVLYNLGVMSYTERYKDFATLKVLGFKDKKIKRLLISQNLWLSVIGVIFGVPAGLFTLKYLMKALASEYELSLALEPYVYIASILVTLLICVLTSIFVSNKVKKVDMVESLKSE